MFEIFKDSLAELNGLDPRAMKENILNRTFITISKGE